MLAWLVFKMGRNMHKGWFHHVERRSDGCVWKWAMDVKPIREERSKPQMAFQ